MMLAQTLIDLNKIHNYRKKRINHSLIISSENKFAHFLINTFMEGEAQQITFQHPSFL